MGNINTDTAFTEHTLDALQARAKATIHNIANQNVKGFKRFEVRFEDMLREAVDSGQKIGSVEPVLQRDTSGGEGQNNVVMLEELTLLGKTELMHDYMLRRAGGYFKTMNKAIFGR